MRKKDKNECTICKRKFTGDYKDNMSWSTFGHQENEYSICNLCWGSTSNNRDRYEKNSDGTLVFIGTLWDYSNFWRRTARQPYKVAVRECDFCDKTHAFYWRLNRGYSGEIIPEFQMHGKPPTEKMGGKKVSRDDLTPLPPIEDVLDNIFPKGTPAGILNSQILKRHCHSLESRELYRRKRFGSNMPTSKKIKREKKT